MKRKGFTLVELLAVIVILAVISIITVPMIGNVIEDSKKKALETSVNGLVETANYFTISNDGIYEFIFDENKKGETINGKTLDYSGSIDAEGSLYIDKDGNISLCLENEDYYVYKNYNSGIYIGEMIGNGCVVGYDALTNKYVAMLDDGTGSISNVYSIEEVNNLVDGLETKIDNNSTSINAITGVVNTNKSTIESIQSSLSKYALQEDLDTTNSNVSNINNQVSTNTDNISNLQTTIGNLATTTNVEAVNSIANKNKTDITNIQTQLGSMATTSNIDALNTLINTNKNNISTNTTNITNLQNSIDSLQTSLNEKASSSHVHDDRYYTETEINNKLSEISTGLQTLTNIKNSMYSGVLTSGTILDNRIEENSGTTIKLKFIVSTNIPSDVPVSNREFFVLYLSDDIAANRQLVIAFEYANGNIYFRPIFRGAWNGSWRKLETSTL